MGKSLINGHCPQLRQSTGGFFYLRIILDLTSYSIIQPCLEIRFRKGLDPMSLQASLGRTVRCSAIHSAGDPQATEIWPQDVSLNQLGSEPVIVTFPLLLDQFGVSPVFEYQNVPNLFCFRRVRLVAIIGRLANCPSARSVGQKSWWQSQNKHSKAMKPQLFVVFLLFPSISDRERFKDMFFLLCFIIVDFGG